MRLLNKKIVITELQLPDIKPATAIVSYENDKADRVELFYSDSKYVVGNIYVAHVNDLVKNINAAFVEYSAGEKAYLSLEDNEKTFFINRKNTTKVCQGDNIVVQIKKEPIKTKDAVCSSIIEIPGKYAVLTYGKPGISVSSKIKNDSLRNKLVKMGETFVEQLIVSSNIYTMLTAEKYNDIINDTGIIFRTEAAKEDDFSIIEEELNKLFDEMLTMFNKAVRSPGRTCVKEAEVPVITTVKEWSKIISPVKTINQDKNDTNSEVLLNDNTQEVEIITDSIKYHNILENNGITSRLYDDKLLPLYKLYSIESVLNQIQARKIWLKSGGYLIIDYTEAMTVIDVNTGKCEKGKNKDATIFNINIEAATEAMRQLRLRNISGIIIIDFIDMKIDEHKQKLLKHLKLQASKDLIKTSIMGMTRLNLVEITRKKIRERVLIKSR